MKKLFLIAALAVGAMTASAQAADAPVKFRLCTGNSQFNYYKAGHILKKHAGSVVEVVESAGSLDNLDKVVAGECDGAFVQSDSLLVYSRRNAKAISTLERAGILYQEQLHLLCNRKTFSGQSISDLNQTNTVAIGADGAGPNTTWAALVLADKDRYGKVQVDTTRSGQRALSAVSDGSEVQCALFVTSLHASLIQDEAQKLSDQIVVVSTADKGMARVAKDSRGQAVYTYGEIPANAYPRIQPTGMFGQSKAVDTMQVDAVFVANVNWISAHGKEYDGILRGFGNAKPEIKTLVQPQ